VSYDASGDDDDYVDVILMMLTMIIVVTKMNKTIMAMMSITLTIKK